MRTAIKAGRSRPLWYKSLGTVRTSVLFLQNAGEAHCLCGFFRLAVLLHPHDEAVLRSIWPLGKRSWLRHFDGAVSSGCRRGFSEHQRGFDRVVVGDEFPLHIGLGDSLETDAGVEASVPDIVNGRACLAPAVKRVSVVR